MNNVPYSVVVQCLLFSILWTAAQALTCTNSYERNLFSADRYCFNGCCTNRCCSSGWSDTYTSFSKTIYLSGWAIGGIVVGIIVVVIIVILIGVCCANKSRAGRVIHHGVQPNVSVITTSQQQQQPQQSGYGVQYPLQAYPPPGPGMSSGYPAYPDTKGPPPQY
ncbi:uncharacterized protein LOC121389821 [Gigantopelta aegis]|uniref:uncharacterized protein LOC121389821 n=1 Tax=Gigantopelta aegis TaxID=1735272 RepID=UPI001B888632|nr:uncharacterized protein LOC121389821 [Gigantopelta aegis]